jgi:hypothetical protein
MWPTARVNGSWGQWNVTQNGKKRVLPQSCSVLVGVRTPPDLLVSLLQASSQPWCRIGRQNVENGCLVILVEVEVALQRWNKIMRHFCQFSCWWTINPLYNTINFWIIFEQ